MSECDFLFLIMAGICLIFYNVEGFRAEEIIGGEEAAPGQFKYHVSLQVSKVHCCGGTIIGDHFILTVAHCLMDNETADFQREIFSVVASALDVARQDGTELRILVESIYVLKDYNPILSDPIEPYKSIADIAILKLQENLGLERNGNLKKLEIPPLHFSHLRKSLVIAGYGFKRYTDSDYSEAESILEFGWSNGKLRFAEAEVVPNHDCNKVIARHITTCNICARVKQRHPDLLDGVSTGDSGGSIVYNNSVVMGVLIATPIGCLKNVVPGIYTRISHYFNFINDVLNYKKTPDMRVGTLAVYSGDSVRYVES